MHKFCALIQCLCCKFVWKSRGGVIQDFIRVCHYLTLNILRLVAMRERNRDSYDGMLIGTYTLYATVKN